MISKTRSAPSQLLGRWKLEECEKKVDTKANWANEDHCGACGDTALQKQAESRPPTPTKKQGLLTSFLSMYAIERWGF